MRHATREIRLASAVVEAADTLVEGFEAIRYLQRVCDHCVELLNTRAAGVILIDGGRSVSLAAGSRHEQVALDLLEAQHGGGPCLDSYGSGEPVPPVSIRVAHTDARWPDFTERALRHDIVTTFAVPLRRREHLLGALNVFVPTLPDTTPADGVTSEFHVAQALADGRSPRPAEPRHLRPVPRPVRAVAGNPLQQGPHRAGQGDARRALERPRRPGVHGAAAVRRVAQAPTDPRRTLYHQVV
ncbi:GAF domain-containing protein [Streptomyces canus]